MDSGVDFFAQHRSVCFRRVPPGMYCVPAAVPPPEPWSHPLYKIIMVIIIIRINTPQKRKQNKQTEAHTTTTTTKNTGKKKNQQKTNSTFSLFFLIVSYKGFSIKLVHSKRINKLVYCFYDISATGDRHLGQRLPCCHP